MIVKEQLKDMRKVGISVWDKNGKLINGKKSHTFTIYDTDVAEVLEVMNNAFAKCKSD